MVAWLLCAAWGAPVELTLVASVRDAREHAAYTRVVASFEEAHPGVDVHLVTLQWQGWDVHDTLLRFGALEDPWVDVLLLDTPWVPELARPGWLLPLDDRLPPGTEEAFVPVAREGGRYGGRTYGLPLSLKGNALLVRTDLLGAVGLDPPQTMDELEEAARALSDRVEIPIALHHDYLYNDVLPFLHAAGGGLERDGRPVLDHPVNAAVLDRIAGWYAGPLAVRDTWAGWAGDYTAPDRAFVEGRVGFLVSWSPRWQLAQEPGSAVRGAVAAVPVPGLERGQGSSNLGSWYLAVSRFSRHPDLAVELVVALTSEQTQRTLLDELGEIPSRRALLADRELAARHPQVPVFGPLLARAALRPRVPTERAVGAVVEEQLHRVVRGERDAASALAEAQRAVEPLWEVPAAPAAEPVWLAPAPTEASRAWVPAGGAIGLSLLAIAGLIGVLGADPRWARGLRPRLMGVGGVAVLVVALLQSGASTALMLREQARELARQHSASREALHAEALSTAKDLSLAASLLWEAGGGAEAVRQLLTASHFSESLVGLALLDADGNVELTAEQALFAGAEVPELPDLAARVRAGTLSLRELPTDPPTLEVLAPIYASGVHAGALRVVVSEEGYRARVAATEARHGAARTQQLGLTATITGAVLVLGLLAIVVLSRRLTGPIEELTGHARRIRGGDLQVRIVPRSADEVGQLASTMATMVDGLRDRDFLKDAFGRYLTPALAERLLSDPEALALGGRLQRVTILMSDLRGFTRLSEELGPERTVSLLNRYLGCMTEVIVAEGGTIDEFLGDAILVLFGAPFPADDDARRAVRCAVRMQQAMVALNAANTELGLPVLEMGIGLCTGEVVAGNIGSDRRVKYGVVGDPVNTAARVEGLTVGEQVLLAASTVELAGPDLALRGPAAVELKGKAEPLEVYELLSVGELALPRTAEAGWTELALAVDVLVLRGKRMEGAGVHGVVARATARRLQLDLDAPLQTFGDLRLRITWADGARSGDVYAKVVAGAEGIAEITSASAQDRARLAAAIAEG